MDYTNDNGKNPISSSIMQDDDNLSLSAWINSELRRRQSEKLPIQNDWIENINFYSGIQYNNQGYNDYTFRFMNNNDDKVVYNRIRKIGEALKASINTGIRVPVATPISSSDIDIRNAKISTDVINHVMRQNSMEKQMSKIGEDLTVYGNCFWKDTWDINAGRTLSQVIKGYQKEREMLPKEFVEQMDLWIQENMDMREGDISIKRISPFSIYPDNINRECLDDVNSMIVSL